MPAGGARAIGPIQAEVAKAGASLRGSRFATGNHTGNSVAGTDGRTNESACVRQYGQWPLWLAAGASSGCCAVCARTWPSALSWIQLEPWVVQISTQRPSPEPGGFCAGANASDNVGMSAFNRMARMATQVEARRMRAVMCRGCEPKLSQIRKIFRFSV